MSWASAIFLIAIFLYDARDVTNMSDINTQPVIQGHLRWEKVSETNTRSGKTTIKKEVQLGIQAASTFEQFP
jgi:hypothetical protein